MELFGIELFDKQDLIKLLFKFIAFFATMLKVRPNRVRYDF